MYALSSLQLEQFPAAKTLGNGPLSGKMSHYIIMFSLVICLTFWPFTFICLEVEHWKRKFLLGHFLPHLVILRNVHHCTKHNYFIKFMLSPLSQNICMCFPVTTPCYFVWRILGSTCVGIDFLIEGRDDGSLCLRILTTQKTILHAYKLGFLIVHVGIEIKHTWSHSTFITYFWFLLWYAIDAFGLVSVPAYAPISKYYLFTIYILGQRYQGFFQLTPFYNHYHNIVPETLC